jgi:predicted nucleic acid-binding Zn ribbon protein
MELLKCPHCQTAVDAKASVCAGCGAEVVRGASRRERSTAGCLFSLAGLVLSLFVVGLLPLSSSNYGQGFAVVLGLFLAVVLFNAAGRGIAKLLLRSKLRFFRNYRH